MLTLELLFGTTEKWDTYILNLHQGDLLLQLKKKSEEELGILWDSYMLL